MSFDTEQLKRFPTSPGVYLMKNKEGKVLYVGKAKNLRSRVKQYFAQGGDGRAMIPLLIAQVATIDTLVVSSEKEALLVENTLIKKHRPKYNALLKDDKTYFGLTINHKHTWPMIRVARFKGKPPSDALYFGPYTNGYAAKQTLELLRHLFPLRQCSDRELSARTRPCILYDMKRCIAPCVEKCTKDDYDALVKQVIQFLRGHDEKILKELRDSMEKAADELDFERADALLQTIRFIEATLERQKVEKAGVHDLDALGIYREADHVVLTQLFFREGKLSGSHDHIFTHNAQQDEDLLCSFLLQHYPDQDELPHEILLPMRLKEEELLSFLLSEERKRKVSVHTPSRGNKRSLVEMAEKNAEARFHREKTEEDRKEQVLVAMEEKFHLTNYPARIECFDNSNIGGTEPVSAMVVFERGEKARKHYRKYKIKTAGPSDDYGALEEVLTRRYKRAKEEDNLPDLIVIDGGRGHFNVALRVLSKLDVSTVDVISVVKDEAKHTKGMTGERVFIVEEKEPISFKPNSPILFFLQQVRDEAHRFAITFQRDRRSKRSLGSALDTIPGIGPIKRQRLLKRFGSLKRILAATDEELLSVPGINATDLLNIRKKSEFEEK